MSAFATRPTPALTAELGPTPTPMKAAVLAAFAHSLARHEAETGEEAAEPLTMPVLGRRNIHLGSELQKSRFRGLRWTSTLANPPADGPARTRHVMI